MQGFRRRGSEVWLIAPSASQVYQRGGKSRSAVLAQRFDQRLFLPFNALRLAFWLRQHRIEIVNPHSSRDGWMLTIAARLARVPLIIRSRHFDVPIPNKAVSRLMYAIGATTSSPPARASPKRWFRPSDLPPQR